MPPHVSVVMSVTNRPVNLRRTLEAWSTIDYPSFDFIIVDNGTKSSEIYKIIMEFYAKLHVFYVYEPKPIMVNQTYNKWGKESKGEYVVFAMMDEIISHPDVLQKMVAVTDATDCRSTLATVFLGKKDELVAPWTSAPQSPTMGHITGNYRKNWEWFGWYRDHSTGHLWLEQDIHIREVCLGKLAQSPTDVWCYHQFHEPSIGQTRPGYAYHTEAQARLLEPAPSEREG